MTHSRVSKRQRIATVSQTARNALITSKTQARSSVSRSRHASIKASRSTTATFSVGTRAAIVVSASTTSHTLGNAHQSSSSAPLVASSSKATVNTIANLKTPIFIAIVAGAGVALFLLIGLIVFFCLKKKKKRRKEKEWSPIESPSRQGSPDEKVDMSGGELSGNLSFAEERKILLGGGPTPLRNMPNRALAPISIPTGPFVHQSSPTTPNSAQPFLQAPPPSPGFNQAYEGFYRPPPTGSSLNVPDQRQGQGLGFSTSTASSGLPSYGRGDLSPGPFQYGLAVSG